MKLWASAKRLVSRVKRGLIAANVKELTDDAVYVALAWIRVAATKYVDNTQKREWVVSILVAKGIPESVSRFAVELAYQVYKTEFEGENSMKPTKSL